MFLYVFLHMCVLARVLQYEYDINEKADRVVLGRGTYGVVYAGRDMSNQVRIAIKEIPERDSRSVGVFSQVIVIQVRIQRPSMSEDVGR